jgi:energy-coupling factor transport system ATP-binding protein
VKNLGDGARGGGPSVVSCENLTYSYPGSGRAALADVSFELRGGEYVGVVGPNGGGKSTLVRILNGLLRADSGSVRIGGLDPSTEPYLVRKRVGMLFQNPENGLVAPFVEDDVAFGLENLGVERQEMRERVRESIRAVGLEGYERREPHTLSGGEKQRVALAGLLALDPEILLLDEPTSMLDAAGRKDVLERLEGLKGQRTVVHVTHHLEELLDADRILVLNAGRLLPSVSPQGSISDAGFLEENRLTLPSTLRLATALGLGLRRTPEELAQAIMEKIGSEARAR